MSCHHGPLSPEYNQTICPPEMADCTLSLYIRQHTWVGHRGSQAETMKCSELQEEENFKHI